MNAPLIRFENVWKSFGENPVLQGVTFSLYQKEITVIIGKSGEGKSVLLKHVIGLIEKDSGEIYFNEKSVSQMNRKEKASMKRKFSYMFQESALFDSMTVFQNIALPLTEKTKLPKKEIRERVYAKMEALDLRDVEFQYPSQLSGGMKKRAALARALVTEPEIILFDEPTTGLDPIRKNAVHRMISSYQQKFGFTGVIVSHDLPDIFYISQRVIMLDNGKIVFEGTPAEIAKENNSLIHQFITGAESRHDPLTGMAPHTQGERRYQEEMARMQDDRRVFSIVILTVENLYEINRMSGYEAEQDALKRFANRVRKYLRVTDICSRLGLNKILILMPRTGAEEAKAFFEQAAERIRQEGFSDIQAHPGFCFSISVGVAEAEPDKPIDRLAALAESRKNVFYQFNVC